MYVSVGVGGAASAGEAGAATDGLLLPACSVETPEKCDAVKRTNNVLYAKKFKSADPGADSLALLAM